MEYINFGKLSSIWLAFYIFISVYSIMPLVFVVIIFYRSKTIKEFNDKNNNELDLASSWSAGSTSLQQIASSFSPFLYPSLSTS